MYREPSWVNPQLQYIESLNTAQQNLHPPVPDPQDSLLLHTLGTIVLTETSGKSPSLNRTNYM